MVLWGGLRPIPCRVILDCATLSTWIYGTRVHHRLVHPGTDSETAHDREEIKRRLLFSYAMVVLSCILTVVMAGNLTNRWTLTLPMVPYLLLQGMGRVLAADKIKNKGTNNWPWKRYMHALITLWSATCILLGALLCILFPAVELPPIRGPYNVGKVDLYLPMRIHIGGHGDVANTTSNATMGGDTTFRTENVWVRLLYPTRDPPLAVPYLTPATAIEYCYHSMKFGAPPPLKQFDWILHTWRLTERWERDGATLIETKEPLPVVVYSHGLGGHADIYSYQTHSLAAHGNVVLTISHSDGSGPIVLQPDGTKREYDYRPQQMQQEHGYNMEYIQVRRDQTEHRIEEVLAATRALHRWNEQDAPAELPPRMALSFKERLDLRRITLMGHSFGGATVLSAAHRYPDLFSTVLAHEPAIDWCHPSSVASLFAQSRIADLPSAYMYNTTRFGNPAHDGDDSLHRGADMLLLFSHEWVRQKWALTPLIQEMQQQQRLGSDQTIISFDFIPHMHHNEFSDTSMLMPTWLSRGIGITGSRNPIHTAKEVAQRSRQFLEQSRRRRQVEVPSP